MNKVFYEKIKINQSKKIYILLYINIHTFNILLYINIHTFNIIY